jgi:hypothetical protein
MILFFKEKKEIIVLSKFKMEKESKIGYKRLFRM